MKRIFVLGTILSVFFVRVALGFNFDVDTVALKAKPVYGREAKIMAEILGRYHYRKLSLNDSLSSVILDAYLKELDNNKTYFLASDIRNFEKYRYTLDNLINEENVNVAYDIYNVFRQRYQQRMDYVKNHLLNQNFDFTVNEFYETDRDKEPWAKDEAEVNDLWRKIIKSQFLSLELASKKPEEIKETVGKRYDRFTKSFNQFTSDDVFSIYMNCVTEAYDPHTNYLSPKATDLFNQSMSLSLEGIGAQLQTENDFTKVAKLIPGGPAEKSDKIHVNDFITGVAQGKDGEMVDVVGWRIDEVVKLIKGPKGTSVRLQILPAKTGINGPSQEVVFVREKVKLKDQEAKKKVIDYQIEGKSVKLGVISLSTFYMDFAAYQKGDSSYASTTKDVRRLIKELEKEHIDGIVMDLRNNGGGSLAEAIDLTGLFIKTGPVVQVRSSNNEVQIGEDDDASVVYTGPLVVLTNRFSASASEIFAGAIQDYNRGVIVGEGTYGKGTVQNVIDLKNLKPFANDKDDVGELKLTIQKFYRVSGSSTQHKGVTPDVSLPSALSADQYGESANLSALPWDVIKSTSYQKTLDVSDKLISKLNQLYQERLKTDPSLKKYFSDTEDLKKNLAQTKVSLNENIRKIEIAEAEKKKTTSDKLDTQLTTKEGLPASDLQKLEDEYLRESLLILTEIITKRIG
jgi:carboxyl-terminal processing protease